MNVYAEVAFPLPILRTFSYIVPAHLQDRTRVGARVAAPFGRRLITGFVVHLRLKKPAGPETLKEIKDVLDPAPLFSPGFLAFARRLGAYHFSSWGELLQAALPPSAAGEAKVLVSLSAAGREALERSGMTALEKSLADLIIDKPYSRVYLQRRFRGKDLLSLLRRMERKGWVEMGEGRASFPRVRPRAHEAARFGARQLPLDFSLGRGARDAAADIRAKLEKDAFSLSYLFAPAADREAVYLELLRTVLAGGGRTLFLVPEISPGAAFIKRLEQKLGERAAVLHSRQTDSQREAEWGKIRSGRASVVVGPRSALFAPLRDLKLLVGDEEQDESFIQAESPAFDARQGIVIRARVEGAAAVLGSATPSVGWFHRAGAEGFLTAIETGRGPTRASIVDMTREKTVISGALEEAIRSRLARKEKVLVYLNRKGYASSLVCPRCRHIPKCPHCDIPLTFYKRENKLICRYCRFETPAPTLCSRCGERYLGGREWGIEALEEEVRRRFPSGRVACFDSDAAARRRDRVRVLGEAARGLVDILLGTQLLAHQADLPRVTLVGILNPEALLSQADYRAGQRTFQSLVRMMGTAVSESGEPAPAIIQTAMPDHHSIRDAAAMDYRSFFGEEIGFRRLMNYPPFSCMAEVLFQGRDARALAGQVRGFGARLRAAAPDIEILGQARASIARLRGESWFQVLLRSKKKERLDAALGEVLDRTASVKAVRLFD